MWGDAAIVMYIMQISGMIEEMVGILPLEKSILHLHVWGEQLVVTFKIG